MAGAGTTTELRRDAVVVDMVVVDMWRPSGGWPSAGSGARTSSSRWRPPGHGAGGGSAWAERRRTSSVAARQPWCEARITRKPLALPTLRTSRSANRSAIQAVSESAPRLRCTTRWASAPGTQPRQPALEQRVQRRLPDPDRRVRPDRREPHVVGHVVRQRGADVGDPERLRVLVGEQQRPLVDVDRPDRRGGGVQRHRQGQRPPPAAEVEQVALRRGHGGLTQEHAGAEVDVTSAEHPGRRADLDVAAGEAHLQGAALVRTGGCAAEVVVGLGVLMRPRHGGDRTEATESSRSDRRCTAMVGRGSVVWVQAPGTGPPTTPEGPGDP